MGVERVTLCAGISGMESPMACIGTFSAEAVGGLSLRSSTRYRRSGAEQGWKKCAGDIQLLHVKFLH